MVDFSKIRIPPSGSDDNKSNPTNSVGARKSFSNIKLHGEKSIPKVSEMHESLVRDELDKSSNVDAYDGVTVDGVEAVASLVDSSNSLVESSELEASKELDSSRFDRFKSGLRGEKASESTVAFVDDGVVTHDENEVASESSFGGYTIEPVVDGYEDDSFEDYVSDDESFDVDYNPILDGDEELEDEAVFEGYVNGVSVVGEVEVSAPSPGLVDGERSIAPPVLPSVSREKVSGNESSLEGEPPVFDDLLDELLDDEETFEGFESGARGESEELASDLEDSKGEASASEPVGSPSSFVSEGLNTSVDEVNGDSSRVGEMFERVAKSTAPKRFFPVGVDPEFDANRSNWEEIKREKDGFRVARDEKLKAKKPKPRVYESDFHKNLIDVVTTDSSGRTVGDVERSVKDTKAGRLKAAELEFFKELGVRKKEFVRGYKTTDLASGPLSRIESKVDRDARKTRLEKGFASRNAFKNGSKFTLNAKMVEMLSFLALFKYAPHNHLARMFGEAPRTSLNRLYKMQAAGLVVNKPIYGQSSLWYLTEMGLLVCGYDVPRVTENKLTYSMFPHQFTVNHVAANLWGGKLNVLNLGDFPAKLRTNFKGEKVFGEELTSELEILSSFSKMKLFDDSATYRLRLMGKLDQDFEKWFESGKRTVANSPEMVYGNEWMWTLLPPVGSIAHHVPDLVVKRERNEDGSPNSIAVEVEISSKSASNYEKTLSAYASDKRMYGKVIWVCKTIGPAKKLESIGRDLGLIQSGKLKIVPIWTEEGVFRGKDLWVI